MSARDDAVGAARERAERARALVEAGAYLITPGAVLVYSDRAAVAGGGYTIEPGQPCACPDRQLGQASRLGLPCKHEMAAQIALAERRRAAAAGLAAIEKEFAR